MDDPTIFVGAGSDARFASAGDPEPGLAVIWSRDGKGAPAPGAPGELIDLGTDAFSRYVLARAPDGRRVVVEVQRDVIDPDVFPVTWGPVTNKIIEAVWRRMSLNAAAGSDVTGATVSMGFETHRPLLICRERGVAFQPPSPVSGRLDALRDCRDDETLTNAGLPSWSKSTSRFLVDSFAVRTTSRPQFYTANENLPRGTVAAVGAWDKFIRDLGYMAIPDSAREAAARALGARFPCVECPEAPRCFPRTGVGVRGEPGRGARRLTPLALHPYRAVAHSRERAHFHEHCDILGGAPWTAFRGRHAKTWTTPGVRGEREALEDSPAFMRSRAPTQLDAFRAKLALLEEVVESVAEYHRVHGQPHLGLSTETVVSLSEVPRPDGRFGVELRGAVRGVMLRDLMQTPPGMPMWLPPPRAVAPYAHADIVRASEPIGTAAPDGTDVHQGGFRHARSTPIRITVGRLWDDEDRGTAEAEIDVVGLPLGDTDVHDTDRIRITLQGAGWKGVTLWCRPDAERVGSGSGSFATRLFRVRLTSAQILDLRGASRGTALFGTGAVFRSYGAWYDLHALGMLMARALLDNSRTPLDRVVADALPSLVTLTRDMRSGDAESARSELAQTVADVTASAPLDAFLGPDAVCYLPGETGAHGGRVPPGLWAETLATMAACLTYGTPASLCASTRLEMDREGFCAPIEALLGRLRDLRGRLPEELSGSDPMGETSDAIFDDPRDLRIQQLERELTSALARIERLQSEVASLGRPRHDDAVPVLQPVAAPAEPAQAAPEDQAAADAWRAIYEAVVGGSVGGLPPATDGEPAFEIVKTLASDGLTTMSAVLTALGELGGQEFALEQRNLGRVVRQALQAAAEGNPAQEQRLADATTALRDVRSTIGTSIGMLVEAHGKSSMDGSRQMLLTLSYAMRKELDLSRAQQRKLADIMTRMNDGLGDLIARLYDPIFQAHVQQRLRSIRRGA